MSSADETRTRRQRSADLAAHTPLVRKIASRIRLHLPASVGTDELMQAGLIGLNDALTRFEEGRGSNFETFAARRIEGAMLDALRALDTLSRETRSQLRKVRAAVQRLEQRLGRTPRAKEVANELGWSLDKFHRSLAEAGAGGARAGDERLEYPDHASSDGPAAEDMHAQVDERADPVRAAQQRQRHAALSAAFDALDEAERFVMESIYDHDLTLRDIGKTLGVSESRVAQMSAAVVAKLRSRLHDW